MKKSPMEEAINQAKLAFDNQEVPVGAVVVENGKIISATFNQNIKLHDPTAHAEILAIRNAAKFKNSPRLDNCDIYITLEPCAMCAAAISLARIRRVYYALSDEKFGAIENGVNFFSNKNCHHKPEIYSGISELESKNLLQNFFKNKR